MKGLSVVLVILLVVTGVAVTASRAQPLTRPNPLIGICDPTGPIAPESRCKPIGALPTIGELEQVTGDSAGNLAGDIGGDWANEAGGDLSDPEFYAAVKALFDLAVKAGIAAVAVNLAERALDWAFGGDIPGEPSALAHVNDSIFDPQD